MSYISTEEVKEVRVKLKALFPQIKFSVTRKHHSTLRVAVMESPFEFDLGSARQINHYYIDEHHAGKPYMGFLQAVNKIMTAKKVTESHDGDYGAIPNYYVNLEIGKWDVPHKVNKSIPLPVVTSAVIWKDSRKITNVTVDGKEI